MQNLILHRYKIRKHFKSFLGFFSRPLKNGPFAPPPPTTTTKRVGGGVAIKFPPSPVESLLPHRRQVFYKRKPVFNLFLAPKRSKKGQKRVKGNQKPFKSHLNLHQVAQKHSKFIQETSRYPLTAHFHRLKRRF